MTIDPHKIIHKHYRTNPKAMDILIVHSEAVARKALQCASKVPHLSPDTDFIYEAAMLHDIGIVLCDAPGLCCTGNQPYICHGFLGAELMRAEGFPRHAAVCETHVGVGLTVSDIDSRCWPMPKRDMLPATIEEIIICFADKFFSKDDTPELEKRLTIIRSRIKVYGKAKLEIFNRWCELFGETG